MMLHYEDFQPGPFARFGPRLVMREEIIAFAAEYDPQPMHLDEEAGKRSMLGGLSGSGWHMCALTMRMIVDGFLNRSASLGAPGVEEARWLAPLRPGDQLTLDVEVLECRELRSRAGVGMVKFRFTLLNAAQTALLTMVTPIMFRRATAIAT